MMLALFQIDLVGAKGLRQSVQIRKLEILHMRGDLDAIGADMHLAPWEHLLARRFDLFVVFEHPVT